MSVSDDVKAFRAESGQTKLAGTASTTIFNLFTCRRRIENIVVVPNVPGIRERRSYLNGHSNSIVCVAIESAVIVECVCVSYV